ncbi:MAG: hypothetical protein HW402_1600, partial [Dehalococcoidales bacterium]|nr:hypothetical protein [Dehalococcoidales bacterium]
SSLRPIGAITIRFFNDIFPILPGSNNFIVCLTSQLLILSCETNSLFPVFGKLDNSANLVSTFGRGEVYPGPYNPRPGDAGNHQIGVAINTYLGDFLNHFPSLSGVSPTSGYARPRRAR